MGQYHAAGVAMIAVHILLVVFGVLAVGILAGLVLERRADEDAARLSDNLPQQERRLKVREGA